ncbi:MAG: hypothetical protein COA53_06570 [Rhodobacteraceae bacterium]|nr:MAG: hypothetical protein COA53_06570 [Paracoccaceae bacterium]
MVEIILISFMVWFFGAVIAFAINGMHSSLLGLTPDPVNQMLAAILWPLFLGWWLYDLVRGLK